MSFRIKRTSELLEDQPKKPQQEKLDVSSYLSTIGKESDLEYLRNTFSSTSTKVQGKNDNAPKVGSSVGLSVRIVNSAQEDHL